MRQSTTQFLKCHLSIASMLETNLCRWSYLFSLLKTVSNTIWKAVLMLFPSNSNISINLGCRQVEGVFPVCLQDAQAPAVLSPCSSLHHLFSLRWFALTSCIPSPSSRFTCILPERIIHISSLQTVYSELFLLSGFRPCITENNLLMAKSNGCYGTSG